MTNSNLNNGVMNNAVENAKVANVKYLYYHPGSKGFIDGNGVIVSVVVSKVTVDLRNQVVTTILKDVRGTEYTRTGEFYLYDSAADFENDVKSRENKRYRISTDELLKWAGGDKTAHCDTPVIDYDEEKGTSNTYLNVWTIVDGGAVLTPVVINSVTWDENGKHADDGVMPAAYWASKADAYKWNEYKLIDEDGDEFTERGAEMRLAPTSNQQDILKTLFESFKIAADAGILLFVDLNGNIKAINTADVVTNTKDADPSMLCGDVVTLSSVEVTDVNVSLPINNGAVRIMLKPSDRQLKAYKKQHPSA